MPVRGGAQGSSQDRFASTAATLVRSGIPAVIAMQHAITDRAAIEFSQTFYESLADGLPVDGAVSEARKAIRLGVTNTLEWGTPVLYSRAVDGRLFDVETRETRQGDTSGGDATGETRSEAIVPTRNETGGPTPLPPTVTQPRPRPSLPRQLPSPLTG